MLASFDPYGVVEHGPRGKVGQAERLLVIVEAAKRPRGVSVHELRSRFGVSRPTVYRDIQILRGIYEVFYQGHGMRKRLFIAPKPQLGGNRPHEQKPSHEVRHIGGLGTTVDYHQGHEDHR